MAKPDPLLKIRFDGEAVGSARIPVSHLLHFLTDMSKAFARAGRVLSGDAESIRRGRQPREIEAEVALDMVQLTHGSEAAVLGFERRQSAPPLPEMDFGLEIIEKAVAGLAQVQKPGKTLPAGYDAGVLMAWRDAGKLFNKGIARIELSLNHRPSPLVATYTPAGFVRVQERIQGPNVNIQTIEGRLLMADFKEHGTRCRVHPSVGEPILCLFDDEQKDEVLEDILQYVRVVGEARQDPVSGKITSIKIHDIERLEDRQDEEENLLPKGSPLSRNFWESPSLDELAAAQGVGPVTDMNAIFGGWPGDVDDGFEADVYQIRRAGMVGG